MKPDEKIHILLVVRWPVGGIRTFLRYVYSRFEKSRYKLTFILPETSELEATLENLKCVDAEYIVLSKQPTIFEFIIAISKALRREQVDIIHSHGFSSGIYAALPAKMFKVPHLLTSHDVFCGNQFSGFKGFFKKIILYYSFMLVDVIHSVGDDAQANLLTYFPTLKKKPHKLVVIQNGIEVERFLGEGKIDWRKKLKLPDDTFLIGFFGRFMAQKGFKYLVEAIGELKNESLDKTSIVLAFGWGGFIREEQADIRRKGLQNSFCFLPFQENVADAIRGVDVVVMPSLWEAYGLLAAEVLVAGVPIVGTSCVGLREVLKGTPAIVLPPGDSKSLANAIGQCMIPSLLCDFDDFRQKAVRKFNVDNQIKKLKELIGDMSAAK